MSYFTSPYRFDGADSEGQLGWAVFLSAAFHLLAAGLIFYVLPALLISKEEPKDRDIDGDVIVVHIPGDIRTNAFDEPLIDPHQLSRDEGQVTENTDQTKLQPSVQADPLVNIGEYEEYVVNLDKRPTKNSAEPVKIAIRPDISIPEVESEPASAIKNGLGQSGGGGQGGSDGPQALPPEMTRYYGLIRSIISRNWTTPAETFPSDITAVYTVTIEPDGRMSRAVLHTSSGHERYDASVLRAIDRSTILPELPPIFEGRPIRVGLMFRLSDLLRARPRVQAPEPVEFPADGRVQAREVFNY